MMPTLAHVRQPSSTVATELSISVAEFYHAFTRVWKPIEGRGGGTRPHIGKLWEQ